MRLIWNIVLVIFLASITLYFITWNQTLHSTIFSAINQQEVLNQQRAEVLNYFKGINFLDVALFSQSELSHIDDINIRLQKFNLFVYAVIVFTVFLAVYLWRLKSLDWLIKITNQGIKKSIYIMLLLGLLAGLFFNKFFIIFHKIFFPAGNWQFDPQQDLIIQIYPPQFFVYFAGLWFSLVLLELLVIYLFTKKQPAN